MFSCKDLLNLNVLSLYEGQLLGIVNKLYFDKKLRKVLTLEIIGEDGNKFILQTKNIYRIGKNAITVKNNQALTIKPQEFLETACPIDYKTYSINGEFWGLINEIVFDEKFLTQKLILSNEKELDINLLASVGKNTVIFCDQNKVDITKFTPQKKQKTFQHTNALSVNIQPIQNPKINSEISTIEPQKHIQSIDFLIGRICSKDIYNFNNEILVKSHSVINKKTIKEVNKYGKLRELMLYSK